MGFTEAVADQAYAKFGFFGLQGSGKTYTATKVAIGLHKLLTERGLPGGGDTPVFMLDTETGSDWIRPMFEAAGIKFMVNKTRAFKSLEPSINEVEKAHGILLIDSVTHYWTELQDAYARKKNRDELQFQDWRWIKRMHQGGFTDLFVNSAAHIITCARLGNEYSTAVGQNGKAEIQKTGIKMKAETEFGYEPSLLCVLERFQSLLPSGKVGKVWRTASVLKDRGNCIDGKSFENPTFDSFMPHIAKLNLGGTHVGVDTTQTSEGMVPADRHNSDNFYNEQTNIICESVKATLQRAFPTQGADDKNARLDLLEKCFDTLSWTQVTKMGVNELKVGHNKLCQELQIAVAHPEMVLPNNPF